MKKVICAFVFLAASFSLYSMDFFESSVEEILSKMTLEEKIGQLFIIPTYENIEDPNFHLVENLIEKYHVGGIISKATQYKEHLKIIDRTFQLSKYPLLSVFDAESGLGFRMQDIEAFPMNQELGKSYTNQEIEEIGQKIGLQCKKASIHVNLAPVVDINLNPQNPIIGPRSFGTSAMQVSKNAAAIMKGMQIGGAYTCIKHFPGHGDVKEDSHIKMPILSKNLALLEQEELVPFQVIIDNYDTLVMSGHILLPCIDAEYPASLSKKVLSGLLRKKMGFSGIIITDALNMKALVDQYSYEEIALLGFKAGNDILLYGDHITQNITEILSENIPRAIEAIYRAVLEGSITESQINEKIAKKIYIQSKLEPSYL